MSDVDIEPENELTFKAKDKKIDEVNEALVDSATKTHSDTKERRKAYFLYDGTEDSAYMLTRNARDKEFEMYIAVPEMKGNELKQWNEVKKVVEKEDNQVKYLQLKTANAFDLDEKCYDDCCDEIAQAMIKNNVTFLFIGVSGDTIANKKLQETVMNMPAKLDLIAETSKKKDCILRVGFPNQTHSNDFIQHNRENLGLNKIFK